MRLEGDLRVDALWAAVREVVRRHGTLRTAFGSLELRAHRVVTVPVSTTVPG